MQLTNKDVSYIHKIPLALVPNMVTFQTALIDLYGKTGGGILNFDWKIVSEDIVVTTYWEEPSDLLKELRDRGAVKAV